MMCYWSFTLNTIHNKNCKNQERADLYMCQEVEAECNDFEQLPSANQSFQNSPPWNGFSKTSIFTGLTLRPQRENYLHGQGLWPAVGVASLTCRGRLITAWKCCRLQHRRRQLVQSPTGSTLGCSQHCKSHSVTLYISAAPGAPCHLPTTPRHLSEMLRQDQSLPRSRNPRLSIDLAAFSQPPPRASDAP